MCVYMYVYYVCIYVCYVCIYVCVLYMYMYCMCLCVMYVYMYCMYVCIMHVYMYLAVRCFDSYKELVAIFCPLWWFRSSHSSWSGRGRNTSTGHQSPLFGHHVVVSWASTLMLHFHLVILLYAMSTPSRGRGETQVSVGRRTVVTFLGDDVRTLSWS